MKVLYLHQYFKVNSGGTRSYEFSKHLVDKGSQVTMISGGVDTPRLVNGIKVKFTKTDYNQNFGYLKRIYSFIHFIFKSIFIGLKEKDIDVIYATSTPLTIGIPAIIISKLKRKPFVFEVRDVWPDIPIELGVIKSGILKRILYIFEKIIYYYASDIVVLSDGMKKNLLEKGIPKDKITVITNLSINKNYENKNNINRKNFGNDKFKCIHHGTMGLVNGLDFILDVAKEYPNEEIEYHLIGDGNQKDRLKKRIEDENILYLYIKDSMPKDKVIKEVILSDIGIMSVENHEILEDNSANKFFDYLAAGLPVLINYKGWQKKVLEENKAGKSFDFNDKKGFYQFVLKLKENKQLRDEYGESAKELAINKYDSHLLASEFESILKSVIRKQ